MAKATITIGAKVEKDRVARDVALDQRRFRTIDRLTVSIRWKNPGA
jgi:hypothetical protein